MVWPCEPISAIFLAATRKRRQAVSAASAKVSPRRKFSWLRSPAEMGCCSATRRISLRSLGGALEICARATSMASAEVPDIRPSTRKDLGAMWSLERSFRSMIRVSRWADADKGYVRDCPGVEAHVSMVVGIESSFEHNIVKVELVCLPVDLWIGDDH